MTWDEFCTLLTGLGEDSPLVQVVRIRLEDDPKMLGQFSEAQHRIRNKWRTTHSAVNKTAAERDAFLRELEAAFAGA